MTANTVMEDARVARVRELKAALAAAKARLVRLEEERDSLLAHFDLALVALHDFEQLGGDGRLHIIDGWNVILRRRNVSKLTSDEISRLKTDYLVGLGIVPPRSQHAGTTGVSPVADSGGNGQDARCPSMYSNPQSAILNLHPSSLIWIVFDGGEENSYRSGAYRVTYTGGTGPHRADRLILDYVHAARILGLDTSRIAVDTADKTFAKKLTALGAQLLNP